MTAVFVTGGAGFIGGAVLEAYQDRGEDVRALVPTPADEAAVVGRGAIPFRGDLSDQAAVEAGMSGAEVVVHCVGAAGSRGLNGPAATRGQAGARGPARAGRAEVEAARVVLAAARASGATRLVFVADSPLLLGDRPLVDADESWSYPQRPASASLGGRIEAERLVLDGATRQLATMSVRPGLVWGEGDTTLLPSLAALVDARRFRWVHGGSHSISTTQVRNVAEGVLAAAERGRGGEAYFVTDGAPTVFRDFVTALLATQGIPAPTASMSYPLARASAVVSRRTRAFRQRTTASPDLLVFRVGVETCTVQDAKARRELGYEGRVSHAEGLAELRSGRSPAGTSPVDPGGSR